MPRFRQWINLAAREMHEDGQLASEWDRNRVFRMSRFVDHLGRSAGRLHASGAGNPPTVQMGDPLRRVSRLAFDE